MGFDPMRLEAGLHYPDKALVVLCAKKYGVQVDSCRDMTKAGAMETPPCDLGQSVEHEESTGTQSAEDHGPVARTQPIGNGRIIGHQQHLPGSDAGESSAGGNDEGGALKCGGEKKRKKRSTNWSREETGPLLKAVSQKRSQSDDNKLSWEGVAEQVPGRTGDECRMRMDTLNKHYNAMKERVDDRKEVDFENLKLRVPKLPSWFDESTYNYIRDHCPPKPKKKPRDQDAGKCSASGEVGVLRDGFHDSGEVSKAVGTATEPLPVSQGNAASGEVRNGAKSSATWNGDLEKY